MTAIILRLASGAARQILETMMTAATRAAAASMHMRDSAVHLSP
jgi:hypothetical protein